MMTDKARESWKLKLNFSRNFFKKASGVNGINLLKANTGSWQSANILGILNMISDPDFYTQYNYQFSERAEWNMFRYVTFSEKLSPTCSFLRNQPEDVFHHNQEVKQE